jgi:hypothetical protein
MGFFQAVYKAVEKNHDAHGRPPHLQEDNTRSIFHVMPYQEACSPESQPSLQGIFRKKNIVLIGKLAVEKLYFDQKGLRKLAPKLNKQMTIHG